MSNWDEISNGIVDVIEGVTGKVCDFIDGLTTGVINASAREPGESKTPDSSLVKWKFEQTENGLVITGCEVADGAEKKEGVKVMFGMPISSMKGDDLKLIIPAEIDGQKVVGIGDMAFHYLHELVSVIIPFGVTSIGYCAFGSCDNLVKVKIPDSVTSIGESAFSACWELESVVIPTGVTAIRDWTFAGCVGMKSVTIPDTVTKIGDRSFQGCGMLTTVTIPFSVTDVGESAFWGCEKLRSIKIPDGVTAVGKGAFYDCNNLTQGTRDLLRQKFGEDVF
jgi:hypothetical protein